MLFILSGPSGVGKSYCVEYLCRTFSFKTVIPFTTRPPRISESEGFHYHFRSVDELREITANLSLGYWAKPLDDGNIYGYMSHVDSLASDPQTWIIQAYTDIGLNIKKKHQNVILIFLDYADDETLSDRINNRYLGAAKSAIDSRFRHARYERENKGKYDHIVSSNNPEQIARELLTIVFSYSIPLPQGSISAPGPLSDADILKSLAVPNGLRIDGIPSEYIRSRIAGWSLDLALAHNYYRIVYPLVFRRVFDLAQGNSRDMLKRFRECIATDSNGIFLKPQEFILASTIERLQIPPGMVCMISGRSSYARMGISIELSQVVLQPGHNDVIPLQIKNNMPYPIIIYPGISIAQAVFFNTITPSESPYSQRERVKYPPHTGDVRSRYYLDPAYEEIRSRKPVKRAIDWDHLLDVLLILGTWFTAASWFVSKIPDPLFEEIGRQLSVVFFATTTLTLLVRVIRIRNRKR